MNPTESELLERIKILELENLSLREHINILQNKLDYFEKIQNKKPGQKGFVNTEVIAYIKQLRLQGYSLGAIAKDLNDKGIKPKSGRQWYKSSVKLMINK